MKRDRHSPGPCHEKSDKRRNSKFFQRGHQPAVDPAGGDLPLLAWGLCEVLPADLTEAERRIARQCGVPPLRARLLADLAGFNAGDRD